MRVRCSQCWELLPAEKADDHARSHTPRLGGASQLYFTDEPEPFDWQREGDYLVPDGTASEVELGELVYGLVRMIKPQTAVETGTYLGWMSRRIGLALKENGFGHLWTCDPDDKANYIAEKCSDLPVTYFHGKSEHLAQLAEADFIFSDSSMESRPEEWRLAKPGCVFLMHDVFGHADRDGLRAFALSEGMKVFDYGRGFALSIK